MHTVWPPLVHQSSVHNRRPHWGFFFVLVVGALAVLLGFTHARAAGKEPADASATLVVAKDGRRLAPDIARIINRGELVVAMLAQDVPPFFQDVDGRLVGADVDLAEAMARELKVKVRFDRSAKTFNEVVEVVADGRADLGLSKLGRTLGRAQQIVYSDPYLALRGGLLINRVEMARLAGDRPLDSVIRGFQGRMCVLAGSSWEEFAKRYFPKATLVPLKIWDDCVRSVQKGEVAVGFRDEFEVRSVLKRNPKLTLTLRTAVITDLESSLAVAVGSRDAVLLGFVNTFIAMRPEKLNVEAVLKEVK